MHDHDIAIDRDSVRVYVNRGRSLIIADALQVQRSLLKCLLLVMARVMPVRPRCDNVR